jgi:hypothetical protein
MYWSMQVIAEKTALNPVKFFDKKKASGRMPFRERRPV